MSILYAEEHLTCVHYRQDPLVKNWSFNEGRKLEFETKRESTFLFLRKGTISISFAGYKNIDIEEEHVLLLPVNNSYIIRVKSDVEFLSFVFDIQVMLCENFSMVQLFPHCPKKKNPDLYTLAFNQQMRDYLHLLAQYVAEGVNCIHFYQLKKQELFYLLRLYYTRESLALFFDPILNKQNLFFKKLVMEKCLSAKNVRELAGLVNYSTSGFIKKFERCFGESPYKWISNYKARHILQDINGEELSFKDICCKYNFSSMPHFIQFCKKQYGITPGKIRKIGNNL
jgi:AraC-like DNA-binding protein